MDNSSKNQLRASQERLNRAVVQRPFNPLYDGKASDGSQEKINLLYIVPIVSLLLFLYVKTKETDTPNERFRAEQIEKTPTNEKLLFDEEGYVIGEIDTKNDPFSGIDSVDRPRDYNVNDFKSRDTKGGIYASENARNQRKYTVKTPKRTILTDIDGLGNSLVFAGSFVNQENAEKVLSRLKSIGYEKAEIVMKENLPYKVVVTGFDKHQNSAKNEVKALEKRGIDVYSTSNNLDEIYRRKQ